MGGQNRWSPDEKVAKLDKGTEKGSGIFFALTTSSRAIFAFYTALALKSRPMPRPLRRCPAGLVYHVLNRAVGPRQIFFKDADYAAFQRILAEAIDRAHGIELFTYCLMPNHRRLLLRPAADDQLSEFMRWLTITHAQPIAPAEGPATAPGAMGLKNIPDPFECP
jgi:REP element-mobilizing transposase RayT